MGVLERYKKSQSKTNETESSKKSGVLQRYEAKKRLQSINTDGVDKDYINAYLKDANSFFGKSTADGSEYGTWKDLVARAETATAWLQKNKSNMSEPEYIRMATTLSRLGDKFNQAGSYWSQFDSEDAYRKAVSGWLDTESGTTADSAALRQQLLQDYTQRAQQLDEELPFYAGTWLPQWAENLLLSDEQESLRDEMEQLQSETKQYERTQGVMDRYYRPETEEFLQSAAKRNYTNATKEELQEYDRSVSNGLAALGSGGYADEDGNIRDASGNIVQSATAPIVADKLGMFLAVGDDEIAEAYNRLATQDAANYGDSWAELIREGDMNSWKHLTEYEINLYYDLYNREGKAAAYKFLEDMSTELNRRATQEFSNYVQNDANTGEQIGLNIASIPMNIFGGVSSFADDVANIFGGDDINPYSRAHAFTNAASTVREHTAKEITEATGNASLPWLGFTWGDVYQSLMSAVDSAVGSAMGGNVYGVLMGTGAASSEMKKLYERGASTPQMVAGGLLAGAAEMVFEKWSIDKLVKTKDAKTIKDIILNTLKQGGVEASEEIATELANTITNTIIMGSQSDWVDMETFVKNVVNAGLGGFISGGTSGGLVSTLGYAGNAQTNRQVANHAKAIYGGSREDMQSLVADALEIDPNNALAKRLQKKLDAGKSLSGRDLAQAAEQISAAIEKEEGEKGARTERDETGFEDLSPALEALLAARETDSTTTENNAAESDSAALERERNLQEARWLEWERDRYQDLGRAGKDFATARAAMEKNGDARIPSEEAFKIYTEAKNEAAAEAAADRVKVTVTESGEDSSVVRVSSTTGGNVTVELADGSRVAVSDVTFASPDTAVLYTGAATMNAASANAMIEGFETVASNGGDSDALNYVRGWQEAYNSARYGIDLSESRFASTLNEEQLEAATQAGKADRNRERATVGENRTEKRKGTLHRETDTSNLSEAQATAVEALERLTQALGIDIYLYSEAGSTHNGWYDRADGSIHLNLAADLSAEGTLLFTAAHELTHYIRDYAPDKFGTLADFLMEQYGQHGVSVSELVERQMAIAEEDGRQIDYDTAFEEVIASSMETMLQSGNVVEAVAKLKAKDSTLWERFAEYFRNLAERIRKVFKGLSPTSREGRYVGAMKDAAERLEAMFTDALVTASGREQTKYTAEGGVKWAVRNNIVDENGRKYERVVELDYQTFNKVKRKGGLYIDFIRRHLINQKIEVFNSDGSKEIVEFARENERVTKDGSDNSRRVIGELTQARNELKKLVILNAAETARISTFNSETDHVNENSHQWLDKNGWDYRTSYVKTNDGMIYPVTLYIAKARDGRNILYDVNVKIKEGVATEKNATSLNSKENTEQAPRVTTSSDNSIPHESDSVKRKFSTDSADVPTLQADKAALRADVARMVEMVNLQKGIGTRFTEESVQAAAKRLMEWAGARGDVRELAGLLHGLYEFIAKGEGVTWDTIRERSEPIVDWLSAHRKSAAEVDPEVQDLRRYLRPLKVKLSDAQRRQVEALYGSYNEYRKQLFGTVNLSNDAGVTLDEVWSEMAGQFPGIFDASEVDTDMPGVLLDVVKAMRENRLGSEMELALDAMIEQGLYQQVYESYWDAATMRSLGEVTDRKIADLKREHKKQMDDLRRRRDEQIQRIRKEAELEKEHYRKRSQLKEAEAREKYRKSLDNYRDARERTELRRKAYKVYSELLTMLKDPTKTKHILPELQKAVAEALKVVDMDSVNAAERVERLQIKLKEAKTDAERAKIEKSIARIEAASEKVADRLGVLEQAYKAVLESPEYADEYGAEEILRRIEALKEDVKDTTFVHLNRHQLQKLYELFVVTRTQVRNANRLFDDKRNTSVVMESNRIQEEVAEIGKDKNPATDRFSIFRKQEWNNLKPVYAVEKVGARGFRKLFDGLLRGESKYGVDMKESRDFFAKTAKDFGYWKWDHEELSHYESSDGKPFALNLLQKMSLYAYYRRGDVALRHIEGGGLTFDQAQKYTKVVDGKKVDYYVRCGDKFPLTRLQVHQITETLSPQQKQFVETMQEYLSKNMGAKGNEVARVLYGIDLFGEPNYFPMQTVDGGKEQTNAPVDLVKLREMGMTQKTQANASNALKLGSFTDVWANHCHQMSLYHSMVLPLEDFTRVFNYTAGGRSVKDELQAVYGKEAAAYFEELLKQLNGGVRADSVELAYSKWLSSFKKAATFFSLSVVIQQRSAVARAYGEILPQYFRKGMKGKENRAKTWAELQKYAGCAGIKEMGGFDTGTGGGSAEWLVRREYTNKLDSFKGLFNFKDSAHRDEVLSRLPALMDEMTWCDIWRAVKAETADRNPSLRVGSEEFLKAAGERFTEVIAKTQVYDSILSRSANMRSKGGLAKMMTAFMAEPTTTINMFGRGLRMMADPQTRGKGARYCSAVVAAAIYNSALVSIIYAMRDDDEDETYLEKYLSSFTAEAADSMNPFTYLPFYRDIMSILQGWDVARADMTLFSRAVDALESLGRAYTKGDEAKIAEGWWNVGTTITDFFGIPLRNAYRDVKAVFNFAAVLKEDFTDRDTTLGALGDQIQEGLRQLAPLSDVYWDKDTKSDKLYSAIVNGDEEYLKRMSDGYDSDSALQSAICKGLRENEPRIKKAAKAYLAGDMEEYTFLIEQITGEGKFDEETVRAAVSAEISGERADSRGDDAPDTDDLTAAYESGDNARAEEIMEELVAAKIDEYLLKAQAEAYEDGDSFDEADAREEAEVKARASVRSTLTRYWKPLYVEAYQSGDVDECERIEDLLNDSGLYGNAKALRKTLKSWRSDD